MPVELWPVMQHRMASYRTQRHKWWGTEVTPELTERLMEEIADLGASTARDLDDGLPRSRENWGWNWSSTRRALDYLFMVGDVAVAGRTSQFEIRYDLPERVIPPSVLGSPTPSVADANRELVRRAARSHGVATARCLADYYRMRLQPGAGQVAARQAIHELVEEGELVPVTIDGWKRPAYLHRDARRPREGGRPRPAQPVRPRGVGAGAHRAALRLPLPDRDLRAPAQAGARLLRAAVPPAGPDRRARRPEGGPGCGPAGRQGGVRRARTRPRTPPTS